MIKTYDDIKNEYGYIRHQNLLRYEEKKADIYEKHPKLKELDFAIISSYVTLAKGEDSDINAIKKERDKYLKEHGIVDDYLEVKYTCDKCKDTGFIEGKKCSCFIEKEIECFDKVSHFKDYIKNDNFDNLDETYYNQPIEVGTNKDPYKTYMHRVIMHIMDGIKNIDKKPYNLLFMGSVGTGKTFLARAIGAEFIKKNKSVLYVNVNEYLNSLKPDYDGEPFERYAVLCDLFILDDLGTENTTEFANSKLNYIIDKRLSDNKSTIITTNLMPEGLEKRYLNSMVSRIMCMYNIRMLQGEDLRRLKYANS